MRLPLWLPTLLTAVAIAGCSGQANVNITLSTETPSASITPLSSTPLSAPTLGPDQVTITPLPSLASATRTPRATATRLPTETVPLLEIGDQSLPIPAGAKETRNIPAVARNFVQNQLKGQSRIGQPQAYQVPGTRDQLAQDYRQELSDAGWQVIPINGLQDPLNVLFAQKANVRATIVFATEDNGSTLLYIIGTRP